MAAIIKAVYAHYMGALQVTILSGGALLLLAWCPGSVFAYWPQGGLRVSFSSQVTETSIARAISDGEGGAIIVWASSAPPDEWNIYAQRVSASGTLLWGSGDLTVCNTAGKQDGPAVASDGAGGAFVFWVDERNLATSGRDIYAQRIDATGAVHWAPNGVAICAATGDQETVRAIADGTGGAIAAWSDERAPDTSFKGDIYAQRLTPSGAPSPGWGGGGVGVCLASGVQHSPDLATDNAGGAIVAWQDGRTPATSPDIYARRVTASGTSGGWPSNGVAISDAANSQEWPVVVTDGAGGAIVSWDDSRTAISTGVDVYAQRVNAAGTVQWSGGGIPVCAAPGEQSIFDSEFNGTSVAPDGASGVLVAWEDRRGSPDIYALRISSGGSLWPGWIFDGTLICDATDTQQNPAAISDGAGGAIIAWEDRRGSNPQDLYAQKVSASGSPRWTPDGISVASGVGSQQAPLLVTDGIGGAIVLYLQAPFIGSFGDIYAQRVDSTGASPPTVDVTSTTTTTRFDLSPPTPNPTSSGTASVTFTLPATEHVTARVCDPMGRVVQTLDSRLFPPGVHVLRWDGRDASGRALPSGLYFIRVAAGRTIKTQKLMLLR